MQSVVLAGDSAEVQALESLVKRYKPKIEAGSSVDELASDITGSCDCAAADAKAFFTILDAVRQDREVSADSVTWAARFARPVAATQAKKGLWNGITFMLTGALGVGALAIWNPRNLSADTRQALQWLVLGLGVLIIIGFLGTLGNIISWFQYRGAGWPEHAEAVLEADGALPSPDVKPAG